MQSTGHMVKLSNREILPYYSNRATFVTETMLFAGSRPFSCRVKPCTRQLYEKAKTATHARDGARAATCIFRVQPCIVEVFETVEKFCEIGSVVKFAAPWYQYQVHLHHDEASPCSTKMDQICLGTAS